MVPTQNSESPSVALSSPSSLSNSQKNLSSVPGTFPQLPWIKDRVSIRVLATLAAEQFLTGASPQDKITRERKGGFFFKCCLPFTVFYFSESSGHCCCVLSWAFSCNGWERWTRVDLWCQGCPRTLPTCKNPLRCYFLWQAFPDLHEAGWVSLLCASLRRSTCCIRNVPLHASSSPPYVLKVYKGQVLCLIYLSAQCPAHSGSLGNIECSRPPLITLTKNPNSCVVTLLLNFLTRFRLYYKYFSTYL